ncbi:hypothetical protein ACIQV3_22700 [Streptomyces sp. NPDC099050]|uniref:hypothetical protein n=1 Tax=Streptomyces sp. NPDC099050 TaxID=3366100 RepID=UPI00382D5ACD
MSKDGRRPGSLRISGSGLPGGTEVQLDGQNIERALAGVTLRVALDEVPTAVLDVVLHDLSTEVENPRLVVPGETHKLLVLMGWTPPEGDGAS